MVAEGVDLHCKQQPPVQWPLVASSALSTSFHSARTLVEKRAVLGALGREVEAGQNFVW